MQAKPPPFELVIPRKSHVSESPNRRHTVTVDEALQYTPIVTSVLHAHDRIPLPQIRRPKETSPLATSTAKKAVETALAKQNAEELSDRIRHLLDPESLAEIKFKRKSPTNHADYDPTKTQNKPSKGLGLSPVAKMVLDMTKIDYRYPSPISPPRYNTTAERSSTNRISNAAPARLVDIPATITDSYRVTKDIPPTPTTPRKSSQLIVEIPAPPSTFRRDDYVAASESPKRRKIDHDTAVTVRLRSQQELTGALLDDFQNQLSNIFEAQDRLESDTSGLAVSTDKTRDLIFEVDEDNDDLHPRVTSKVLDNLQSILKQLVNHKGLLGMDVDQLRRLQKICEPAMESSQTEAIALVDSQSEQAIATWRSKIRKAENGIAAACVFAQIILGNPHEEMLLAAEPLKWLPSILVNAFESCLIPTVESRPEGPHVELYQVASQYKDDLKGLMDSSRKLLDLVSTICVQVKGAEDFVNAIEFLAAKLIFVQNPHNDKGSALGTQVFERARKVAMAALAKIYARHPAERKAILDEILSSLDKLPSTSRSARQYKLGDGTNIQLVSALFMQLVQTTSMGTHVDKQHQMSSKKRRKLLADGDEMTASEEEDAAESAADSDLDSGNSLQTLRHKTDKLFNSGVKSAQDIISYIVGKASVAKKTGGESAYRSLLDLFLEDLINALPFPDWPASELLLRLLTAHMVKLASNEKASIKTMALESIGTMGSAISIFRSSVIGMSSAIARNTDGQAASNVADLLKLADDQMLGSSRVEDLVSLNGPFAVTVRFLKSHAGETLRAKAAYCYYLAQYAKLTCMVLFANNADVEDVSCSSRFTDLATSLLEMIKNIETEASSGNEAEVVTQHVSHLAHALCVLNLGFCRQLPTILRTLVSSLSSDQAHVRTRSIKSVTTMLETDSGILDRDPTIIEDVFRCASDDSAMVRDSALSLIAKVIISKPALEEQGIRRLLECAADQKVAVQKRALNHLKDIYVRDSRENLRGAIAQTFLRRTNDVEESVASVARNTLIELWIAPNSALISASTDSARADVAIESLTTHLVRIVKVEPSEMASLLKTFLMMAIKEHPKETERINALYSKIANALFQSIISESATNDSLITLQAVAEARPEAIAPQQLASLKSYLENISTEQDLYMFKSVITIFRSVLPRLSTVHNTLLKSIQDNLMQSVTKLGRRTDLDEVMQCLRVIDGVLNNTVRLIKLAVSVLNGIRSEGVSPTALPRYLRIAGSIGRYIDLEPCIDVFRTMIKDFRSRSVAEYMVDVVYARTLDTQPSAVRIIALESLGSLCQTWAGQLSRSQIRRTFFHALAARSKDEPNENSQDIERGQLIVLKMFEEMYAVRAAAKGDPTQSEETREEQDLKKLGGDKRTMDEDSAIAGITQELLTHTLRIALSEQGERAFLAVQTLASMSHQGLLHPKQCTGPFVALETSTDSRITKTASAAHQLLHQQHESVCEREYTKAVQQAFAYQMTVAEDSSGALQSGYTPKLAACFRVVKTSNSKYVKKFLSNIITRSVVDIRDINTAEHVPENALFARFVSHNVAFFEYDKMEELYHTILQLELVFSKTTAEIQQEIESIPQLASSTNVPPAQPTTPNTEQIEFVNEQATNLTPDETKLVPPSTDSLKRSTAAAVAATMLWEARSHLKRQYGLARDIRSALSQSKQSKELGKQPSKAHGIAGDRFWNNTASIAGHFANPETMLSKCRDFLSMVAVDEEVKVAGVDEDMAEVSMSVEPDDELKQHNPSAGRGKKRRSSVSVAGTPKRLRGRPPKHQRRSSSTSSRDDPNADFVD